MTYLPNTIQTITSSTTLTPGGGFYLLSNNPIDDTTVSLLLRTNGTTFTDVSRFQNTNITINGDNRGAVTTTFSKWGTGSMYFDANGDSISITPRSGEYLWGTAVDFTIDFWAMLFDTGDRPFFTHTDYSGIGGGAGIMLGSSGGVLFINRTYGWLGSPYTPYYNTGVSLGTYTWNHIAMSRQGTSLRLFVNGVQAGPTLAGGEWGGMQSLVIGQSLDGPRWFHGQMEDFRITRGLARYTANFSVPTEPFPIPFSAPQTTATLPSAVTNKNSIYYFKSITTTSSNIVAPGTQTIDGAPSITLRNNEAIGLVSDGSNWRIF